MWSVEPATPEDAPAVVELFRSGFPERLQPLVIYGCRGGSQYIADYVQTHRNAGVCAFVTCRTAGGGIGAFAEFRVTGHTFFLNHIYVAPERRGQGLGTILL